MNIWYVCQKEMNYVPGCLYHSKAKALAEHKKRLAQRYPSMNEFGSRKLRDISKRIWFVGWGNFPKYEFFSSKEAANEYCLELLMKTMNRYKAKKGRDIIVGDIPKDFGELLRRYNWGFGDTERRNCLYVGKVSMSDLPGV